MTTQVELECEIITQVEFDQRKADLLAAAPQAPPTTAGPAISAQTPSVSSTAAAVDAPPGPLEDVGSRVRIDGISSRPELNGQFAVCLRHVAEKGRWFVRLEEGDTSEISLKEQALTVVGPWSGLCLGAQCGFFGSEAFTVLSADSSLT